MDIKNKLILNLNNGTDNEKNLDISNPLLLKRIALKITIKELENLSSNEKFNDNPQINNLLNEAIELLVNLSFSYEKASESKAIEIGMNKDNIDVVKGSNLVINTVVNMSV